MKIFIVGLGLIGASYAEGLKEKGHRVYGYDQDKTTMAKAKVQNIIEKDTSINDIETADLVIIALYPEATIAFLKAHQHRFNKSQTLSDVCGIKTWLLTEIERFLPAQLNYTSHHPMAGKETPGFDAKDKTLFKDANFLIVKTAKTHKRDLERLEHIANDLNFGQISLLTPQKHDALIAYTSQLTHVMASSLILSSKDDDAIKATGNSFRDLTRIAKIHPPLWSELFLNNKTPLLQAISQFKQALSEIESLLERDDEAGLKQFLKNAKKRREFYD